MHTVDADGMEQLNFKVIVLKTQIYLSLELLFIICLFSLTSIKSLFRSTFKMTENTLKKMFLSSKST